MQEKDEPGEPAIIFIGDAKKQFYCEDCRCNVFTKRDDNRYVCNGCNTVYIGEK